MKVYLIIKGYSVWSDILICVNIVEVLKIGYLIYLWFFVVIVALRK